jgi:hypothetical protein
LPSSLLGHVTWHTLACPSGQRPALSICLDGVPLTDECDAHPETSVATITAASRVEYLPADPTASPPRRVPLFRITDSPVEMMTSVIYWMRGRTLPSKRSGHIEIEI